MTNLQLDKLATKLRGEVPCEFCDEGFVYHGGIRDEQIMRSKCQRCRGLGRKAQPYSTDIAAAMDLLLWWEAQGKPLRWWSIGGGEVSLINTGGGNCVIIREKTPAGIARAITVAVLEKEGRIKDE